MANPTLLASPLDSWHVAHGGRMVEFGGWSMPLQYKSTSIIEEHQAVRNACGLFDVSHMGRLWFTGPTAASFLSQLITRDVTNLPAGRVRYALCCHESGGTVDDVLVSHVPENPLGGQYLLVVNASNRLRVVEHLSRMLASFWGSDELTWKDATTRQAMLAIQGPKAKEILGRTMPVPKLGNYRCALTEWQGQAVLISRTGYTGEDGYEVILDADGGPALADALLAAGEADGLKPAGLGCRDTLRLEAAMPLYGHELSDEIDPIMAGLQFAVELDREPFIGQAALKKFTSESGRPVRVGLKLASKRIARQGAQVAADAAGLSESLGEVTSGTFSPTLGASIAMAYVDPSLAEVGRQVVVDIRGSAESAEVVPLPFYTRPA